MHLFVNWHHCSTINKRRIEMNPMKGVNVTDIINYIQTGITIYNKLNQTNTPHTETNETQVDAPLDQGMVESEPNSNLTNNTAKLICDLFANAQDPSLPSKILKATVVLGSGIGALCLACKAFDYLFPSEKDDEVETPAKKAKKITAIVTHSDAQLALQDQEALEVMETKLKQFDPLIEGNAKVTYNDDGTLTLVRYFIIKI